MVEGTVSLDPKDDTEISFKAPLKNASYFMKMGKGKFEPPEDASKGFEYNKFGDEDKKLEIDTDAMTGEGLSAEQKTAIAESIQKHITKYFDKIFRATKKMDKASLPDLKDIPMDSILPMAFVYYITQASSDINFADPFVEFGSSLTNFNLLTDKQKKMLEPI